MTPIALADLLEMQKGSLLDRWSARVLRDPGVPSAARLSQLALYNHFPAIVDRIVATLRTRCMIGDGAEELGASIGTTAETRDHVRDRAQAGFRVP
ncbi:MAG: RsbRD N-terminal domain-containing protein, partial [Polyangiaceae bacterium]